ncbi:LPS export ABC transporter periplasmic protein LptC [Candidatus Pelagibacter sp.]|nr:LPS export ABC transporter periplasmic protein LptC [Candidatus Pelagibacter sp.]
MKYKIIIQIIFIIIFFTIMFLFYYKYFSSNNVSTILPNDNLDSKDLQTNSNLIKDLTYQTTDINGNKYYIFSEYGEVDVANSEIIIMKNVSAKIEIFNKDTIHINSLTARYNTLNYETNFNKKVKLKYLDHKIFSDNMDLSFQKKLAWLYENVNYKGLDYELFADKIEIDLITKNSKIFEKNTKKVKIIKK